jgi:hypothetical protein
VKTFYLHATENTDNTSKCTRVWLG